MVEIKSYYLATPRLTHYVIESGPQTGIPIIFVHGNLASSHFYRSVMAQMPESYHCYSFDQRIFGRSPAAPIEAFQGVKQFSDDLHEIIICLNLTKVHLVGWSLGGAVIMKYAIDHNDLILSLVLVAPISPFGFYGTNLHGNLNFPDGAGSGVSLGILKLFEIIKNKDVEGMRRVFRNHVMFSENSLPEELENEFINEFFLTKTSDHTIPGNMNSSDNWPG